MLRAGSLPEAVFNLAVGGLIQLCVSEPIMAEYEEVLGRPRLGIPREKIANAMDRIRQSCYLIPENAKVDVGACPADPDDVIVLECAESAATDYLATGNRKHYPAEWKQTRIVTAREFVELSPTCKAAIRSEGALLDVNGELLVGGESPLEHPDSFRAVHQL